MKVSKKLEMLSSKLGVDKPVLLKALSKIVLDHIQDQVKYYETKASADELLEYLDYNFLEEDILNKVYKELQTLND